MKRGGAAIVLCYHHIADAADDPLNLSVHPDRFRTQIEHLRTLADIVQLPEIAGRRARPQVAITFDDGYADTAETAVPILESANAPATVFVPTASLERGHEFWWERLAHLVLEVDEPDQPALEIHLGGQPLRVDVRTAEGRLRAFRVLNDRLVRSSPDLVDPALEQVASQLGGSVPQDCEEHRKMTRDLLEAIDRRELVEIGGHTRTHALLSKVDERGQEDEVAGGRVDLERIVAHPVTSFAYPYGYRGSFDDRTVRIVRDAGYERACTTVPDRVPTPMDVFRVPRHQVRDWDGDSFRREVASWLVA